MQDLVIGAASEYGNRTLLVSQDGKSVTYSACIQLAESRAFANTRLKLVTCVLENNIDAILGYFALLAAGAVVQLVPQTRDPHFLDNHLRLFRPSYLWLPRTSIECLSIHNPDFVTFGDYVLIDLSTFEEPDIYPELRCLLSTSGSTGSGKFVRLTDANLATNAIAIKSYLGLSCDDVAVTVMPPSYSFGLSILNSHVAAGATIAVTQDTFFNKSFWNFYREVGATSFSGVPYHFEMLKKIGLEKAFVPTLRYMTQAGGRLERALATEVGTYCLKKSIPLFLMYGQTESSPRMSFLDPELVLTKPDSIGRPLVGGTFHLADEEGNVVQSPGCEGELVYSGPNVCLGYAESRKDLSKDDGFAGVLKTGDVAKFDADGDYFIVGRKNRFLKVYGVRINLAEVETLLGENGFEAACTGDDRCIEIFTTSGSDFVVPSIKKVVSTSIGVPKNIINVYLVKDLPRSESGKIQYIKLMPDDSRTVDE